MKSSLKPFPGCARVQLIKYGDQCRDGVSPSFSIIQDKAGLIKTYLRLVRKKIRERSSGWETGIPGVCSSDLMVP